MEDNLYPELSFFLTEIKKTAEQCEALPELMSSDLMTDSEASLQEKKWMLARRVDYIQQRCRQIKEQIE